MSRDNYIYFLNPVFPHDEWATILSTFSAESRLLDEWDEKHGITHRWSFDGVHGGVHIDLVRINPNRHSAPWNCCWKIGVHCKGHHGIHHWFLYAIPLLAIAHFDDTIFYDPGARLGVAACDVAGVVKRMQSVLPQLCDVDHLVRYGFTHENDPFWPRSLDQNFEVPAAVLTWRTLIEFCLENNLKCLSDINNYNCDGPPEP